MDIGLLQAGLEGILQVLENFCLPDRSCGRPRHQRALLRLAQAEGHLLGAVPELLPPGDETTLLGGVVNLRISVSKRLFPSFPRKRESRIR